MKKNHLLLITATALLLGACNNDDILTGQAEEKGFTPQLVATVEQIPDTRAGVVEDADYTQGEQFYWSNVDMTRVYFKNAEMTPPLQFGWTDYWADVSPGVKSNSCTFQAFASSGIDNGQYIAYGFFPKGLWGSNQEMPISQVQTAPNSTHLGHCIMMRAQNQVTVDGSTPIHLSYKQLTSVLRFAVWNNSNNADLRLINIHLKLQSGKSVFGSIATLQDINDTSLSVGADSKSSQLNLALTSDAQNFSDKEGKSQCEGYMAVLPTTTDAFEGSDDIVIELSLTDGESNYIVTKEYNIGEDLAFLSNGIEQGYSYYFRMRIENTDLSTPITGKSYALGDYWPDDDDPEGVVFWLHPGRFGTKGKVVGLKESYIMPWGPDISEESLGVAGIRSLDDGATATKNMIATHKNEENFESQYPAFHYVYTTVNDGQPDGPWYLPTRNELKALYAGYSGKVYEEIVDWKNDYMPGYDNPSCHAARADFNQKLADKGGMVFGSNESSGLAQWYYMSTSEITATYCWSAEFTTGNILPDNKGFDFQIRWIQEF